MGSMVDKNIPQVKKVGRNVQFDIHLNGEQGLAKEQILKHAYTFILGKAGTGKTQLAVAVALDKLFKKEVSKIVITRPTVSTEDNGFLPGTLEEKLDPWLVPIKDTMRQAYSHPDQIKKLESEGVIEIAPLTFFRGRTFNNAVCIVDEFQNLTKEQLAMALGRLGKDSIMIFCGDKNQIDLKNKLTSATQWIDQLRESTHVSVVELFENHRHPAVEDVLNILYRTEG